MTGVERGVLLLCCPLGDPEARPLSMARFRDLSRRARALGLGDADPMCDLRARDLLRLGYSDEDAANILALLEREERLEDYVRQGRSRGIFVLTRLSEDYPAQLVTRLGDSAPPVFFGTGNRALLRGPCVALAGSRTLRESGAAFSAQVGLLAASEGLVLVTGGAEGADREAERTCLRTGGCCVTFLPDRLDRRIGQGDSRHVFLSAGGYDIPFSPARALTRNTYVHMMGEKTLIAQTGYGAGGTWNGSIENLKHSWSPLFVHDDGSEGSRALIERGATPVWALESLKGLRPLQEGLF